MKNLQKFLESYQVLKGKCSCLLLTVVYFESFQNRLTFCKMIKTNVLLPKKITPGCAASNEYRILPSKGKYSDLLSRN